MPHEDLRRTYERVADMGRKNPWLWKECFTPPYRVEWEAYKTLDLLSDYDGALTVKIDEQGIGILIYIDAETTFQHPDVFQIIRLKEGVILENIVEGNIRGKSLLEHYRKYFARLPDDVKELLKPIL